MEQKRRAMNWLEIAVYERCLEHFRRSYRYHQENYIPMSPLTEEDGLAFWDEMGATMRGFFASRAHGDPEVGKQVWMEDYFAFIAPYINESYKLK